MGIKIRLGDADRATLGVPAQMSVDPDRLRVQENRQMRAAGWSNPQQWLAALNDGDLEALTFLVWLGCRRNGYRGSFDDIDFELADLDLDVPTPAGEQPGEAGAPQAGDTTASTQS